MAQAAWRELNLNLEELVRKQGVWEAAHVLLTAGLTADGEWEALRRALRPEWSAAADRIEVLIQAVLSENGLLQAEFGAD